MVLSGARLIAVQMVAPAVIGVVVAAIAAIGYHTLTPVCLGLLSVTVVPALSSSLLLSRSLVPSSAAV